MLKQPLTPNDLIVAVLNGLKVSDKITVIALDVMGNLNVHYSYYKKVVQNRDTRLILHHKPKRKNVIITTVLDDFIVYRGHIEVLPEFIHYKTMAQAFYYNLKMSPARTLQYTADSIECDPLVSCY